MANDEDDNNNISFSEFLSMDRRNDSAGARKHPGARAPPPIDAPTAAPCGSRALSVRGERREMMSRFCGCGAGPR
eukprot:7247283-Prymnesium_polylepis.1